MTEATLKKRKWEQTSSSDSHAITLSVKKKKNIKLLPVRLPTVKSKKNVFKELFTSQT